MEYEAVQKLKEKLLEIGKETQGQRTDLLPIIGKKSQHNTREDNLPTKTNILFNNRGNVPAGNNSIVISFQNGALTYCSITVVLPIVGKAKR